MKEQTQPWVLVRGAGDLATGVILRLERCGFRVAAAECAAPSAIRRKASLCEAVWQGSAQVEGVTCRKVSSVEQAEAVQSRGEIPLLVDPQCCCLGQLRPAAVVDAILAKRNLGTSRAMAPMTVGLGPGFVAGAEVDAVVETMRGHDLGRVIWEGSALPNTGIPAPVEGWGKERVIHAPAAGPLEQVPGPDGQLVDIGAWVSRGQLIARVGGQPVCATLDGVLRGLIRPGYPVTAGMKIADIDPRPGSAAWCGTVSDKARAIGGAVVEALLVLSRQKGIPLL